MGFYDPVWFFYRGLAISYRNILVIFGEWFNDRIYIYIQTFPTSFVHSYFVIYDRHLLNFRFSKSSRDLTAFEKWILEIKSITHLQLHSLGLISGGCVRTGNIMISTNWLFNLEFQTISNMVLSTVNGMSLTCAFCKTRKSTLFGKSKNKNNLLIRKISVWVVFKN